MPDDVGSIMAKLKEAGPEGGPSVLKQIVADWAWVGQVQAFSATQPLQSFVKSTREQVEAASAAAREAQSQMDAAVAWAVTPSETTERVRSSVLGFRRKYPGVMVAGITAVSLLPGLMSRNPRILLRNSVIGGGTASLLLYPEFVMRTAPYAASKLGSLEEAVKRKAS